MCLYSLIWPYIWQELRKCSSVSNSLSGPLEMGEGGLISYKTLYPNPVRMIGNRQQAYCSGMSTLFIIYNMVIIHAFPIAILHMTCAHQVLCPHGGVVTANCTKSTRRTPITYTVQRL
jgi:hypothetical protein